jgi:hypothetical protein
MVKPLHPYSGPSPSGGSPPPGPSGLLPSQRFCIRHSSRELSAEDVAAGHTRCADCRAKLRESASVYELYLLTLRIELTCV